MALPKLIFMPHNFYFLSSNWIWLGYNTNSHYKIVQLFYMLEVVNADTCLPCCCHRLAGTAEYKQFQSYGLYYIRNRYKKD